MLLQVFYSRPNTTEDDTEGSHQRCSIKKGALRNFAKFTEKTPVPEPLF